MVTQATSTALDATNVPISCALTGLYFVNTPLMEASPSLEKPC